MQLRGWSNIWDRRTVGVQDVLRNAVLHPAVAHIIKTAMIALSQIGISSKRQRMPFQTCSLWWPRHRLLSPVLQMVCCAVDTAAGCGYALQYSTSPSDERNGLSATAERISRKRCI